MQQQQQRAICLGLAVRGQLPAGVVPVERVPGDLVVAEGRARGWDIREHRDVTAAARSCTVSREFVSVP